MATAALCRDDVLVLVVDIQLVQAAKRVVAAFERP